MVLRKIFSAAAVAFTAVVIVAVSSVPTNASAADPRVTSDRTFSFSGTFTADATRTFTKAPVRVNGDITIAQDAISLCPAQYTTASYGLYVQNVVTLESIDGYHIWTQATAGTWPVSATVQGAPGEYRLQLRAHCGASGLPYIPIDISRDSAQTISIAGMQSYRMETKVTDRPGDPSCAGRPINCMPPQITDATFGQSVILWYTAIVSWTDGVQTTEHPCGAPFTQLGWSCAHQLQFRKVGGDWRSLGGGNQTLKPAETGEYRYLVGSQYTEPALVRVPTITSQMRFPGLLVTPQRSEAGTPIEIKSSIEVLYSDGVWRNVQDGSQVTAEFLPKDSTDWRAVGPTASTSEGRVSIALEMPGTGVLRLKVGGNVSDAVRIAIPGATDTIRFGPLDGPTEVAQGQSLRLTSRVEAQWDDSTWRPATSPTSVNLQFAAASSGTDSAARWLDIATGLSADGAVAFTKVPFASGFWRLESSTATSDPIFVRVRGLPPLSLAVSPTEPGTKVILPNAIVDVSLRMMLTGYSAAERPSIYVTVPGGSPTRVGSVDSAGLLQAAVTLRAPTNEGPIGLLVEARDAQGRVLASAENADLRVERGVASRPMLSGPSQAATGSRITLVATLSTVTSSGALIPARWTGQVHLEAATADTSWQRVATLSGTGRENVPFSVPASPDTSYRIIGDGVTEYSEPFAPRVLSYSGNYRFASEASSQGTANRGTEVVLSAEIQGELAGGGYSDGPDGVEVTLQRSTNAKWVNVANLKSLAGRVEARIVAGASASYRFVGPDGTVSKTISVRVRSTGPDALQVTWPTRVSGTFKVVAVLKSGGQLWTRPTQVQLQLKPSGSGTWTTLDRATARSGRATLSTSQLKTGTWRVVVIGHNLEDARVYGSA